jgi:hypothetical protein
MGGMPPDAVPAAAAVGPEAPTVTTIDEIVEQTLGAEEAGVTPTQRLGYKIFLWLLGLIVVELALLLLYGAMTYPRGNAWDDNKATWLTSVKDLGQLFLLTPVFPLLGAVIGYMFGKQQAGAGMDGEGV